MTVLEKEIEVRRKEQTGKAVYGRQKSARCNVSTSELGLPRKMMGAGGGGREGVSFRPREKI